ncbi:MAG: hypothetical protein HY879_06970 [Deltaproteobacteria bacterium]|nr:hypothetical protein [Deltaproteobacteria bacterium]
MGKKRPGSVTVNGFYSGQRITINEKRTTENGQRIITMAHIEADNESRDHLLKRIKERYPSLNGKPILNRMINTLKAQAPDDWRFSVSPSARFFVVDMVTKVKFLWVRQSLNWININNPNLEYLYFERLTPKGINKALRKVFSYDVEGVLIPLDIPGCPQKALVCGPVVDKSDFKNPHDFKSDTYWMLPTYLDESPYRTGFPGTGSL